MVTDKFKVITDNNKTRTAIFKSPLEKVHVKTFHIRLYKIILSNTCLTYFFCYKQNLYRKSTLILAPEVLISTTEWRTRFLCRTLRNFSSCRKSKWRVLVITTPRPKRQTALTARSFYELLDWRLFKINLPSRRRAIFFVAYVVTVEEKRPKGRVHALEMYLMFCYNLFWIYHHICSLFKNTLLYGVNKIMFTAIPTPFIFVPRLSGHFSKSRGWPLNRG